jgi:hypothetical protein
MIEKIILVLSILLVFLFSTLAILHADMSLAEKYFGFAMLSLFGGFGVGGLIAFKRTT